MSESKIKLLMPVKMYKNEHHSPKFPLLSNTSPEDIQEHQIPSKETSDTRFKTLNKLTFDWKVVES